MILWFSIAINITTRSSYITIKYETKGQSESQQKDSKSEKNKRVVVLGLIVLAISIGNSLAVTSYKLLPSSSAALSGDGIQCNTSEQLVFHIHAHLDVFVLVVLMVSLCISTRR